MQSLRGRVRDSVIKYRSIDGMNYFNPNPFTPSFGNLMLKRLIAVPFLVATLGLAGCATQPAGKALSPQAEQSAQKPKRQANAAELAAVTAVMKAGAIAPTSVEIKDMWADDSSANIRNYCAQARGNDAAGRMMPWAIITGNIVDDGKVVDANVLSVGRDAKTLCRQMRYPTGAK